MIELIETEDQDDKPIGGFYGLWLQVFKEAGSDLKRGHDTAAAKQFLFDEDNPFFDYIAEQMKYSPEGLRDRLKRYYCNDRGGGNGSPTLTDENASGGI